MNDQADTISRSALLGRQISYTLEADPSESAAYNFRLGFEVARQLIAEIIRQEPPASATPMRCRHCDNCRLLNDGISFECKEWGMDFYAPHYTADTFFCADAKPREGAPDA